MQHIIWTVNGADELRCHMKINVCSCSTTLAHATLTDWSLFMVRIINCGLSLLILGNFELGNQSFLHCSKILEYTPPTSIKIWHPFAALSVLHFFAHNCQHSHASTAWFNSLHHAKMKTSILLSSWQWCTKPLLSIWNRFQKRVPSYFNWIILRLWPNLKLLAMFYFQGLAHMLNQSSYSQCRMFRFTGSHLLMTTWGCIYHAGV